MSSARSATLPALPLAGFFALFYLAPLLLLLLVSLDPANSIGGFSTTHYANFLGDRFSIVILLDTLRLGVEVTLVTIVLAFPLAMVFLTAGPTARSILMFMILLPMLTSTVVRTFAWIVILGRDGVVNATLLWLGLIDDRLRLLYTRGGLVLALAQIFLPLMVLPIINSLLRLDDRLLQASEGLGATRWHTFWNVVVPLSFPGLVAGSLLTFASAATAFITQTLVGGGRQIFMPLLIYQQAIGLHRWSFAAAISMLFMISVVAIVYLVNHAARGRMRGVDA